MIRLLAAVFSAILVIGGLEVGLRLYGLADPVLYRTHPRAGYEPVPGQRVRQRWIPQEFDDRGFRVPAGVGSRARERRIVVLGDSVTYGGTCIRTEETFVEVLNVRLLPAGWRAFNAGVNSYSIHQMAFRYIDSLHRPDDGLVLLAFETGDWDRPPLKFIHGPGPFYLEKPRSALWDSLHLTLFLGLGIALRPCGFRVPADVTGDRELTGRVSDVVRPGFFPRNRQALLTLAEFCRARRIPVVAVNSPTRGEREIVPRIRDAVTAARLKLVDLAPDLARVDPSKLYVDDVHYTPDGHARVAGALLDREREWLPQ